QDAAAPLQHHAPMPLDQLRERRLIALAHEPSQQLPIARRRLEVAETLAYRAQHFADDDRWHDNSSCYYHARKQTGSSRIQRQVRRCNAVIKRVRRTVDCIGAETG